ncbi:MAG: hypothetical protein ACYTF6_02960 [Planctomycetota bacterium]|jgi:hypothetical protein
MDQSVNGRAGASGGKTRPDQRELLKALAELARLARVEAQADEEALEGCQCVGDFVATAAAWESAETGIRVKVFNDF